MGGMFSRFKTWVAFFLVSIVGVVSLLYLFGETPNNTGGKLIKEMTPFAGGKYEASGVAAVPGTDGVLFVDNGRPGQVFWMRFDQKGKQVGAVKAVDLGVGIEDIEGITTDGTYFYVVSSQSRPRAIAGEGLVRFKFDAGSQSAEEVAPLAGLKKFLVDNVAELRSDGDRFGKDGGVNIEGLGWDPLRGRLLLGLRSPIIDEQALLVPLKLRNPRGAFATENLEVDGAKAIRLSLGGLGIRGLEYDVQARGFRIISGAAEDQNQTDFGLWDWNGDETKPQLRELSKFDKNLKPEGVARATVGNRGLTIVVFDSGGYAVVE